MIIQSSLFLLIAFLCFVTIGFSGGECEAAKKKLAILPVENQIGTVYAEYAATTMDGNLSAAIFNTRNYDLVERSQLKRFAKERQLAKAGIVDRSTIDRLKKLTGAEYTVICDVTGAEIAPFNCVLYEGYKAKVRVSLKFIDNSTGLIKLTEALTGTKSIDSFSLGRNGGIDYGSEKTLIQDAAVDVCKKIVERLNEINPVVGLVAAVNAKQVYTTLTSENGIKKGETLIVFREGIPITNPVTGDIIAVEEEEIGKLKVVDSKQNITICEVKKARDRIKVGDKVKRGK